VVIEYVLPTSINFNTINCITLLISKVHSYISLLTENNASSVNDRRTVAVVFCSDNSSVVTAVTKTSI